MNTSNHQQQDRFDAKSLIQWATHAFIEAGLDDEKAKIDETMVEDDLMGHTTHGLQFLPAYPKLATDINLVMWLSCSDPFVQTVAPFGGIQPSKTQNFGLP